MSAHTYPTCSAPTRQECRRESVTLDHARTCDITLPVTGRRAERAEKPDSAPKRRLAPRPCEPR
eukprot:2748434-Prymnesium_polylepis.1